MRMRHIAICGLPRFYNIFPHYLINGTIFEKKLLKTKCVFWISLQLLSVTFLILRRNERDVITDVYRSSCKVPVIVVRFQRNYNFLDRFFSKNTQMSNFMKFRPVGAQLFYADERTDMTKLIVFFSQLYRRAQRQFYSLWRWSTRAETCCRSSFHVCANYECTFNW